MKIIKKFLPVATLATSAMVIMPVISACSKSIDASDLNWKPSSQHKQQTIKMDYSDWTKYKELSKDYYESDSNKHFKEDICYTKVQKINNDLEEIKKQTGVSDASVAFNVTVSDVQLSAQDIQVGDIKFPGYKTSFRISVDSILSYKQVEQVKSEGIARVETEVKNISSIVETVTDFSTFLLPASDKVFQYVVLSNKDNNWKEIVDVNFKAINDAKFIYDDNSSKNISTIVNSSYTEEYTSSKTESKEVIKDKSYYLAKVSYN